ncbi:TonB-dependent receptor [Dyadobacter beijingensis]|uniref:TonB-dependent receptor n=1 Tax=Dyadobacter beijingensis TaxID=365489 RepID=A0ABQ2ILQ4_9BACT|nr:TonB-dependent receptor [Dyadobacter beijingensis]GGN12735.1 TonB-dependent receptor [Dyadobacter beijingensis]
MRKLLIHIFFLLSIPALAQTGTLRGTVTTSDGKPAEFVNVVLERTGRGATVDQAGNYTIAKIPAGSYTLVASFTGLVTQKKPVAIAAGESLTIDFTLAEDDQQLQEVIVRSSANRVTDKGGEMVARMPITNLQNPQAFNVVGKELMKQQNVVAITDAFKNAPGVVATLYPSGGIGALSRGFSTGIDARNGLQTTSGRGSADIANIERIEFIKGPSGTLFGAGISSFGGVVNLVTKKPFETFKGSVDLSVGSFGLGRISADVNTPLNADRSLLLRVNTAVQRQDSYNERGFYNSAMFAPSLLYKASDRLSVLVDAEIYSVNSVRPTYVRIAPDAGIRSYADIPLAYKKSLLENDLDAQTNTAKLFAEARYRLNGGWTSTTNFSYVNEATERSYQDYPVWISPDEVTVDVSRYGPVSNTYMNLQQNFNGTFLTGPLKHTVLAGANVTQYTGRGQSGSTGIIRTLNVKNGNLPKINRILVDSALVPGTMLNWGRSSTITYGAYAADVISLNDRLYAMLSLRYEYLEDKSMGPWSTPYTQRSLSPKLGLVYQLVKDKVSLFANYMNGYQNYPSIVQPDGSTLQVKPIYAIQYEGGVKAELFDKKINTTLSYYYIDIDNAVRYGSNSFAFQDGKQVSKGIEWDFTANPAQGLTMTLGYGYNNNRILGAENLDRNISGNSPQHVANYWVNYQFQSGALRNFGLGAGGNYVSDAYFDDANLFLLPSYHVVNASAFYENNNMRIGFKLNNIGDQKSWGYWGAPNPTRNFVANVILKF